MIRKIAPILLVCFLLFLQVFFHSLYGWVDELPDLVPIALAIAALRWGMGWTGFIGFLAGVMEDSFSTSYLGLGSLSWIIAGMVGGSVRGSLYGNQLSVAVILVAIIKMIHDIIYNVVYLWDSPSDIPSRLFIHVPFAALYSVALSIVLFFFIGRFVLDTRKSS
jgi:rod shape-determining protein MreD